MYRHMAALGCPIVGDDLYNDAAYLPIGERSMAIQAVSVGRQKTDGKEEEERVLGSDREGEGGLGSGLDREGLGLGFDKEGLGLELDRGKEEEGGQKSYTDVEVEIIDINDNKRPLFPSNPIDPAVKASKTTEVRKGVGIFLVCTALDFYHPLKTISGALPKDLIGDLQDENNQLQIEQQGNQQSSIDDRVRMRVECKVGPRFARLKEKAQKGYEWNVQSKGQLQ
jgi:hypothetical protein